MQIQGGKEMSKRAFERAFEFYPLKDYNKEPNYIHSCDSKTLDVVYREVFQLGYTQAEKDLALTWEDVQLLDFYAMECQVEESKGRKFNSSQEFFEEVLRRFNKTKNE